MTDWTTEDAEAAVKEGWDIFTVDAHGHPPYELQADFDSGVFVTGSTAHDNLAWLHVYEQSIKGSTLHVKALEFLKVEAPNEYNHIMEYIK